MIALDHDGARIRCGEEEYRATTLLVPDIGIGDYVLVQAGMIIERLTPRKPPRWPPRSTRCSLRSPTFRTPPRNPAPDEPTRNGHEIPAHEPEVPVIEIATPAAPLAGQLRFIRYAFMPNRLRYCGSDDNSTLFGYGIEGVVDGGSAAAPARFTGALPYLQLIARANGIADPFDARVVEAYWIGNELLDGVEVRQLYDSLLERFGKQLQGRTRDWCSARPPPVRARTTVSTSGRPQRGSGELEHTLATLDQCRVSWGKVVRAEGARARRRAAAADAARGEACPGTPAPERALTRWTGTASRTLPQPGDWVSLHWGWACEVISDAQRARLAYYTDYHLALANQTI